MNLLRRYLPILTWSAEYGRQTLTNDVIRSAQRPYFAPRNLLQNGFRAGNISGGMLARSHRAAS
jgi:hypothetical protein